MFHIGSWNLYIFSQGLVRTLKRWPLFMVFVGTVVTNYYSLTARYSAVWCWSVNLDSKLKALYRTSCFVYWKNSSVSTHKLWVKLSSSHVSPQPSVLSLFHCISLELIRIVHLSLRPRLAGCRQLLLCKTFASWLVQSVNLYRICLFPQKPIMETYKNLREATVKAKR